MGVPPRAAKLSMNADDHQLYTSGTNFAAVREALPQEGQLALSSYRDNFLLANPEFQAMMILLLLFCVLCSVIFKGVLKSIFNIISAT